MAHIKIEKDEEKISVQVEGKAGELAEIMYKAILTEPMLGLILIDAMERISKLAERDNLFNDINLN